MKFTKKPVEIEAVPVEMILALHGESAEGLAHWIQEAIDDRKLKVYEDVVVVRTLEGNMRGERSDWLIKGIQGELYPCKADIFLATYDRAES